MKTTETFFYSQEAADMIGVPPATLRDWENKGKIKALRHPNNNFRIFKKSDLENFMKLHENGYFKSKRKRKKSACLTHPFPQPTRKFSEALLYILCKVGALPNFDEVVLQNLLYFIDFDFFEKYKEKLTGATYKKTAEGPVPIEFEGAVEGMSANMEIEKITRHHHQKQQKKYLPLRNPDLDCLSAKELGLIEEVLNRLSGKTASQIREYSQGDMPFQVTYSNKVIDFETVFHRTGEYSVKDDR